MSHNTNTSGEVEVPVLPPKPIREQCKVLYAYSPVNEDELKLNEGDIVTIVTKELPDKGWWKGELKGKIGVFPDNFVTLLPSSSSDGEYKINNMHNGKKLKFRLLYRHFKINNICNKIYFKFVAVKPPIGTKIINTSSASLKSSNATITSSSYRKNSFGSKDSLNESTNNSINAERNSGIFGNVAAHRRSLETKSMEVTIEKPPRKSLVITDANKTPAEIRKSLENLDEGKKTSTPPPVLTKKPTVPIKKSPSVSTVAGSIFSGLKQKVKSVESKLHAAHEVTDGTGSSKMTVVADNGEKGVIGEKINELDTVERGSYLQDVRQNRAKAPKRRPPTHASGDSNNNSVNMNGSHVESNDSITHEITSSPVHQPTAATLEEEQVKPKAREWEKHKAPWMEELKANQARKTSPNIEQKSSPDDEKHDMSKSFSSSFSHQQQQQKEFRASSLEVKSNSFREESTATKTTTKISITENSSSVMQTSSPVVTKVEEPSSSLRPTSVSLRNRSISPIPRVNHVVKPSPTSNITATHITATPTTTSSASTADQRVIELEQRVNKLETLITAQNTTIEDLKRMLKDESDKVKTLKSDLEKYAQCFTQV